MQKKNIDSAFCDACHTSECGMSPPMRCKNLEVKYRCMSLTLLAMRLNDVTISVSILY